MYLKEYVGGLFVPVDIELFVNSRVTVFHHFLHLLEHVQVEEMN